MSESYSYDEAVQKIKTAILQSQYVVAKSANESQLRLYYAIGRYISINSRNGRWGQSALETVGARLEKEMPGLRGFSPRNLRYMRQFYEEWNFLDSETEQQVLELDSQAQLHENVPRTPILHLQVQNCDDFPLEAFLSVGFTQHRVILEKVKNLDERLFYLKRCYEQKFTVEELKRSVLLDEFHRQGALPNNFAQTLTPAEHAFRAVNAFKDQYLLDFVNVEELGVRDAQDVDERMVENKIVQNVKNFILAFGKDFTFVRNQFHLDAFGEDQYIDLLFFNRALNCLVAVELKTGKFKTSYLGQLQGYLSILDGFEKKEHENPAIGIILCKDMNKSFVDYVVQDYAKPMGVATYKTSDDMPQELKNALPNIDDLRKLLDSDDNRK